MNGDGFDDLLIGAYSANPDSVNDAGAGYVLFGRDFDGTLTRNGTSGADALTGGRGNETLSGSTGNDTLSGVAGNDRLIGGADSDVLDGGAERYRRLQRGGRRHAVSVNLLGSDGVNGVAFDTSGDFDTRLTSIEHVIGTALDD